MPAGFDLLARLKGPVAPLGRGVGVRGRTQSRQRQHQPEKTHPAFDYIRSRDGPASPRAISDLVQPQNLSRIAPARPGTGEPQLARRPSSFTSER